MLDEDTQLILANLCLNTALAYGRLGIQDKGIETLTSLVTQFKESVSLYVQQVVMLAYQGLIQQKGVDFTKTEHKTITDAFERFPELQLQRAALISTMINKLCETPTQEQINIADQMLQKLNDIYGINPKNQYVQATCIDAEHRVAQAKKTLEPPIPSEI